MPVNTNSKETQQRIDNALGVIAAEIELILSFTIEHEARVEGAFDSIESLVRVARRNASKHV